MGGGGGGMGVGRGWGGPVNATHTESSAKPTEQLAERQHNTRNKK